ncbi:MAG: hypothetical protein V1871_03885 [Planctomycetota bacterium]
MEKPKPEEFGITEEQFDAIDEKSSGIVRRIAVAGIWITISAAVALIAYSIFAPYSKTATAVDTIVDAFYSIIVGTIITILIIELYLFRLKMLSPIYKKASQYKTAMKDYDKQVTDDIRKFGSS